MSPSSKQTRRLISVFAVLSCALMLAAQVAECQRDNNQGDEEDFDDAGFDDSGYAQPNRDTDSSNHNPNSYSPSEGEDLDEDDEVDETNVSPRVASERAAAAQKRLREEQEDQQDANERDIQEHENMRQRGRYQPAASGHRRPHPAQSYGRRAEDQQHAYQPQQYQPPMQPPAHQAGPQNFFSPAGIVLSPSLGPVYANDAYGPYGAGAHMRYRRSAKQVTSEPEGDIEDREPGQGRSLVRSRRHAKHAYIGPVYTYVKTDKHANFKWGVKHKVGKMH